MRARRWLATTLISAPVFLWCVPVEAQDVRAGVEQLAAQIVKAAPEGNQLRVAVADFLDFQGVTSDLGRYVASRLTTRLAQTPNFFVIERQRLGQVLAELKFSMSDLGDPMKAKQLGRMAGVEAIVVGTVSDLGNQVDLDARLIEIETNRMLLGATTTISRDQVVDDMLKRGRQAAMAPGGSPSQGEAPSSTSDAPRTATPDGGRDRRPRGVQFVHRLFSFELSDVEVLGDAVKLTFLYTNKTESPQHGYMSSNETYLVDNVGNRYRYAADSFGQQATFPPQIPERISVTFRRLQAPGGQDIQAPRGQDVQAPRSLAGARGGNAGA